MCGLICSYGMQEHKMCQALKSISHRGPDALGTKSLKVFGNSILDLGHVRLSILDLDPRSNQPFTLNDKHYLVFNGEIYNYKELAEELLDVQVLVTKSDTEVLWRLLVQFGTGILSKLEGMFALVFYNSDNSDLIITRDSLGIKPLYYSGDFVSNFVVSSEIKGILNYGIKPEINSLDIAEYIQFGYLNEPSTGFSNIKKIEPGEVIKINLRLKSVHKSTIVLDKMSELTLIEVLNRSISNHQRADVPQVLFYSGGIDSSLLLALMQREKVRPIVWNSSKEDTKAAGFSNDAIYAKKILNHLSFDYLELIDKSENILFEDELDLMADGIEELIGDYTFIASLKLSELVRQYGYIVAHSGMGADEIFGGYPRYLAFKLIDKYTFALRFIVPILRFLKSKKSGRLISSINAKNVHDKYFSLISAFSSEEISELLKPRLIEHLNVVKERIWRDARMDTPLKTAINVDMRGFLSHNFIVADKSSMQASIEMRVPLANQTTLRWFRSANDKQLVKGFLTKVSLRKVLYSFINKKYFRRPKAGFNPPLDNKINNLGKNKVMEMLTSSSLSEYVCQEKVNNIVQRHFDKVENNTYKIFSLLYLAKWLKRYSSYQ